jgi:hypothetical protein
MTENTKKLPDDLETLFCGSALCWVPHHHNARNDFKDLIECELIFTVHVHRRKQLHQSDMAEKIAEHLTPVIVPGCIVAPDA